MAHNADTHISVTSTIAALRAELPELEQHQQRLEAELAAVSGRLEAARDALRALQAFSAVPSSEGGTADHAPPPAVPAAEPDGEQATADAAAASGHRPATARKKAVSPAKSRTAPRRKASARAATTATSEPVPARKRAPGLSTGVLAYLAEVKEPVRAAQVAEALGRETTPAGVNAVRTSLERAVKASKAQRTGRGLYQALPH
ncbi:hypothetical protein GCM10010430_22360 [Kitasatospora cystarginea]|uniref:Regulatory protein n=1 Tax=Kitasatospora cystarginea TaxID=58350 RepID=A0ABN3DTA0_9ACTN